MEFQDRFSFIPFAQGLHVVAAAAVALLLLLLFHGHLSLVRLAVVVPAPLDHHLQSGSGGVALARR